MSALLIQLIAKVLMILGPLAYIYSLYVQAQEEKRKAAQAEAQAATLKDMEAIAAKVKVSNEEERDFNTAADQFNSDANKPSGSK